LKGWFVGIARRTRLAASYPVPASARTLLSAAVVLAVLALAAGSAPALELPDLGGGEPQVWVETDKFVYRPGDTGRAIVTVSNAAERAADVTVTLTVGVGEPVLLGRQVVEAGARATFTLSFDTTPLRWGCCVTASVAAGGATAEAGDYFAVSDSPWSTAVMSAWPPDREKWETLEGARQVASRARAEGFTGYEAFFWGECDMLDFTPEHERFLGGQGAYPSTITGTRNIIRAFHEQGMFATFYANLWGGSGQPALELQRQHPEWFAKANFETYVLDDWDLLGPWWDMRDAKVRAPGAYWNFNQLFLVPPKVVFERHADEIIASCRMFGWDGVRYDSYYTRWWNVLANRMVKRRVRQAVPHFLVGYNSIIDRDVTGLGIADMVGDGGLIMGEAVRIERVGNYAQYAKEVLRWRDIIWSYGGHYGLIYNADDVPENRPFHSAILLAAGVHPYYNRMETDTGDFPYFALRYSEFIYDNRMRPLADPEAVISFGRPVKFLCWQDYARTLDLGGRRHRLVIHLLDVPDGLTWGKPLESTEPEAAELIAEPEEDGLGGIDIVDELEEETKPKPEPLDVPVSVRLPDGAKVSGAWLLTAIPRPAHAPIRTTQDGNNVHLIVPPVSCWSVVVIDYESTGTVEPRMSVREQTDTYIRDWYIIGPFPNPGDNDNFDREFPPEKGGDLAATYRGADGTEIGWRRIGPDDTLPSRPVDMGALLNADSFVLGYATTNIISDRERDAYIFARADDTLTLWINGERVFQEKLGELTGRPESRCKVHLRKGRNVLLAKVCQKWLYWLFAVRIAEEDGTPISRGIRIQAD